MYGSSENAFHPQGSSVSLRIKDPAPNGWEWILRREGFPELNPPPGLRPVSPVGGEFPLPRYRSHVALVSGSSKNFSYFCSQALLPYFIFLSLLIPSHKKMRKSFLICCNL
jgi:hypothetical protein